MASGFSFFVGLGAGVAILAVPVMLFVPGADVPARLGAWIAGPPAQPATSQVQEVVSPTRSQRGFVPGAPTPTPDGPPPTLQPVRPTPVPPRPEPEPTLAPRAQPAVGTRTGVIRSGVGAAVVHRVAGIQSPSDPKLPDGSPVLISSGQELDVRGQRWRAVRGLNGIAGWVPSTQVVVDGEAPPVAAPQASAEQAEQARVTNTGGIGVALRGSPNDADRLPSGLRDGTVVQILERAGADWAHVRGPTGQEGWVPARYLAPQT